MTFKLISNLDAYTCSYKLTFHTNFTHSTIARQVFGAVSREEFHVDINNSAIRYYSGFFFFIYLVIRLTQVLVTWSLLFLCVIVVKVDACA